jgi:quercetin dioxygenase-like cupin family protein
MKDNLTCNQDGASEQFLGGLGIRTVRLPKKGHVIHGHKHNQDHVTFVARGSVSVRRWKDDCGCDSEIEQTFVAGEFLNIEADWRHEITALEDDTIFHCVFSSPDSKSLDDAVWDMAEARG